MFLPYFLSISLSFGLAAATVQIVSGATWTALGTYKHVQAHGGGIFKLDDVYYWIGGNKLAGNAFQSINCYSSSNLVEWTFVNQLLTVQASGELGPNRVVERPHVIYNDKTQTYVMWMHIDNASYLEARAGVATSKSICGTYTYLNASQPLGFQSRDLNVFKDDDGIGYLLTEDRANGLRIYKLSANYLYVASAVYLLPALNSLQAPALYKSGNTYFMFASRMTGWDANDNVYCTATSLSGPWSQWQNFAPAGTNTFTSQTSSIVSINGVAMYMGDRWVSENLMRSTYVWLPLTISGTTACLTDHVNWVFNVEAGTWNVGPDETTIEAESTDNTLAGGAVVLGCDGCTDSLTVGYIGGPSQPGGNLTFNNVQSGVNTTGTTLRIRYQNGGLTQNYANVVVNGDRYQVAFLPSGGQHVPAISVLTVPLNNINNVITFGGQDKQWAPDLDSLTIPMS